MTDNARRDEGLEPCPFCGGVATLRKSVEEYPADGEHPSGEYEAWFNIACDNCGIELGDEYRTSAIAAWNTRALARRSIQEQPEAVLKSALETAYRRMGGIPALARSEGGAAKIIDIAVREIAALASAPPPIAGAGWKGEPTDEMLNAGQSRLCEISSSTNFNDFEQAEIFKAMLTAAPVSPVPDNTDARGAQVKSLEWTEISVDRGDGSRDLTGEIEAETVLGTYSVTIDTDEDVAAYPWCVWTPLDSLGHFASPDEGRAAAQADYASRILAAIVPGTEALDEGADQRKAVAWRVWNKTDPNAGWEFVLDPTWYCRPENAAHFAVDPLFVASIPREIEP